MIHNDQIDLFYKGKSPDVRIQDPAMAAISSGFDIYTHPKRLTPYRAMEPDEDTSFDMVLFQYANSILRGLGLKSGTAYAKIYYSASGPIGGAWTAQSTGEATNGADSRKCFLFFHDYLYGIALDLGVWYDGPISSSPAFGNTAESLTGTNNCQGIITSDDLLLIPYDNKIAKKDGAGSGPTFNWTAAALTLPSDRIITDLIELDANTVAVATKQITTGTARGRSTVYLWDKINVDPADSIDFGEGEIAHLDLIGGNLIGIMSSVSVAAITAKLIVKEWVSGKNASTLMEIESDDDIFTLYGNHTKIKDGEKIYFGLRIKIDGTTYHQLACVGRKDSGYPIAFSLAQLVDNDTAITAINGCSKVADYFFVAHNADGSVNRTQDTDIYNNTAVYITQKINGSRQSPDYARQKKTLKMAGVTCAPLPTDTTISLYMRKDSESAWSLVRAYSTADGTGFEAGQLDTTTFPEPTNEFGKATEWQFKLTTLGAAVNAKAEPTAIIFAYENNGGDVMPA